jgi:hypothetical protein
MTLPSQHYAALTDDSYKDHRVGRADPANPEYVYAGGAKYVVLEHANNRSTGYQGTIYQRVDTREIVVAHRGTEFDSQPLLDGVLADGSMVLNRTNPQVSDAIELTPSRATTLVGSPKSPSPATPSAAHWRRRARIIST